MACMEVSVTQVREVLRADEGLRRLAAGAGVDRKTAQRYVDAALAVGVAREGRLAQLTNELVASVVKPSNRGAGQGAAVPGQLEAQRDYIKDQLDKDVTVVKVGDLLPARFRLRGATIRRASGGEC